LTAQITKWENLKYARQNEAFSLASFSFLVSLCLFFSISPPLFSELALSPEDGRVEFEPKRKNRRNKRQLSVEE
jgi:hypothetical protein